MDGKRVVGLEVEKEAPRMPLRAAARVLPAERRAVQRRKTFW